jgi:tyrosyl-tRNA synthetase
LVDNRDWTVDVTLLDFLRDVGKHVTVNQMLAKESVRGRLEGEAGISYTEFSYMLLQAHDYLWLHEHHHCELQVGGSDQWGNITAGIDLIRRRTTAAVHGLTVPLVTKADGTKFGKSQAGNVWLAPARTSPYQFFQYLVQVDDRDVERFLLQLTLLPVPRVAEIMAEHQPAPERRGAQRELARALTTLVHGAEATASAEAATGLLFGDGADEGTEAGFRVLADEIPTSVIAADTVLELSFADLLAQTSLVSSKSDARRLLAQGGISVNQRKVGEDFALGEQDLRFGRYLLLRRGKATDHLVVAEKSP